MFTYNLIFMILSVIILPCDIVPYKHRPFNSFLNNWQFISENNESKLFSFSQLRSFQGSTRLSGFELLSEIEDLGPDQMFQNFESKGESWLLLLTTNELELLMDKLKFLLELQLNRHNQLLNTLETESSESQEISNELKASEEFYNLLLKYLLMLLKQIFERKQLKFETYLKQLIDSNQLTEFELIQRELLFLQEIKDFTRNLYFFYYCKNPLVMNSSLCSFLTSVYSNTEAKFLSKTENLYEAYNRFENEWEDINDESVKLTNKRKNKRSNLRKKKYKSKAKRINLKKSKLKSKKKVQYQRK
ncbi:hypothetical protein CmeUKMEL1_02660 [Cryptosporidium meleagridis]|uniref:Integral membrane protein n=1 Tax=Cryptosporidium meleagridis TaxID=93969 RepID=A0A2P4YXF1_9CRYT|nr:hypothetical protein CmeUKMEL1_02660 [Cryptosporidium meleagridis]